jgi:glyoxylase-like metal-dependent hydrolase (beta-lactamase superfamily II)
MKQEIIRIDLQGVNCYLCKASGSFILIDTGGHLIFDKQYTDRRETLLSELERLGCKRENLKLIVLTHGDVDHVANAEYIKEKYLVKIAMHAEDIPLVENPTIEKMMGSFKFQSIVLKSLFRIMKKRIRKICSRTLNDLKPFTPDITMNEGDSLEKYGFNAKILHIPGHTEGSIGILTDNNDLIAGDIFAKIKKPTIAPNADNFKKLNHSVERLKGMNINTVYPGHGSPFSMDDFKRL